MIPTVVAPSVGGGGRQGSWSSAVGLIGVAEPFALLVAMVLL
jgi:hypothetical protein